MDISEKYIDLCSKATEIQQIRNKQYVDGDFMASSVYGYHDCFYHTEHLNDMGYMNNNDYDVWLPRQDQLQEMIINPMDIPFYHFALIMDFYHDEILRYSHDYHIETSEQLYLLFVMFKKYKKKWDLNLKQWIPK